MKNLSAVALAISLLCQLSSQPASSQGQPNVSVVNLSVQTDDSGKQLVLTPRGFLVPLPGAGVITNAVQIYMGRDGGFWYVDWTGKSTDITDYVAQVRAQTDRVLAGQKQASQAQPGQAYQQASPPQYAPFITSYSTNESPPGAVQGGAPQNSDSEQIQSYNQGASSPQDAQNQQYSQTTQNQSSSSSAGNSIAGTAMAAGLGAMAGTAASAAYYNRMPYGTPYYYGPHGNPYYRDDYGKDVFVEDGEVKWNNVAAANQVQNNRQQQKIDQAKSYQQQRAATQQPPAHKQAQTEQLSQQGHERFQQQQNWYQNQTRDTERAQAWRQQSQGDNPFVRQSGNDGRFSSRGSSDSGKRSFGDGGSESGGAFGDRAGGREAGGLRDRAGGRESGGLRDRAGARGSAGRAGGGRRRGR